jgi:hypothetical protein
MTGDARAVARDGPAPAIAAAPEEVSLAYDVYRRALDGEITLREAAHLVHVASDRLEAARLSVTSAHRRARNHSVASGTR